MKLRHIKRATQRRAYVNFLAGPTFRVRTYGDANFQCINYDSGRKSMTAAFMPRQPGKATLMGYIKAAEALRALPIPAHTFEVTAAELDELKLLSPPVFGPFDFSGPPSFMGLRIVIKDEA